MRHLGLTFAAIALALDVSDKTAKKAAAWVSVPEFVPTVLRGVVDLVYLADEGWRILDYKSDQIDGLADVDAELLARYGPQLQQYLYAWGRVAPGKVTSADLVALRARRTINGASRA